MPIHRRVLDAGVAVIVGAVVAGCTSAASTGALGTQSPALRTAAPAGLSSAPARTASSGAAHVPACRASHLRIAIIYGGAAGGTAGGVIGFTNEGSTPCRLVGWPVVIAVGPTQVVRAVRNLSVFAGPVLTAPPTVTIAPGKRAVAMLAGHDEPGPGAMTCPPPYRRLRVTPPGSAHATVVPAWIPYFGAYLPTCGQIEVSPVIPASDLPFLRLHHV